MDLKATRPTSISISNLQLLSVSSASDGQLVDLDPIRVSWKADGETSEIAVYVENLETRQKTRALEARSSAGDLLLKKGDYAPILSERRIGDFNRVRVVVQTDERAFYSREFALHVGSTVLAFAFEMKIKIAATVDNFRLPYISMQLPALRAAADTNRYTR